MSQYVVELSKLTMHQIDDEPKPSLPMLTEQIITTEYHKKSDKLQREISMLQGKFFIDSTENRLIFILE